ncbi:MAG: c-type cytochrome [Paracoccus sp. (in: a-proteobacteria)]
MRQLLIATAIATLPFAATAQDDDTIKDVINAREGYMELLSVDMSTLAGMAKGDIPYNADAARRAGMNIEALSQYDFPGLFIAGSAPGDGADTDALPAIWEDSQAFAQKYASLQEAAAGAGESVAGGQDSIGPVVQKLGGTCKACHDDFRKK